MFYIKYLTMYKVHMHGGATRQLLHGCAYVREIIHELKLVDYLPVLTHIPYNNLYIGLSAPRIILLFYIYDTKPYICINQIRVTCCAYMGSQMK